MKTKYILIILLVIFNSVTIASNSDVLSARREFKAVQTELQQFNAKYKKTLQKQEQLQADYTDALSKVEKLEEKPKSLPYKNAVKKSESLGVKVAQNASELESLNRQKDSLLRVLEEKQSALLIAQQAEENAKLAKEEAKIAKKIAKDSAKLAKRHEKDSIKLAKQQKNYNAVNGENMDYSQNKPTFDGIGQPTCAPSQSTEHASFKETWNNADKSVKILFVFRYVLIPVLVIWFLWLRFKHRHHCPRCGKWFTMEFARGHRTRDANQKMVFRSVRRCSECGYERTFFEPIKK